MTAFSQSLKSWRKSRRLSQLDLALEAEVSARHISFLETGRAHPSRDMVARLGDALQIPLDAQNELLSDAGFAVRYRGRDWTDVEMKPIRKAVDTMLRRHMPYPALAIDRHWTVLDLNPTAAHLFGALGLGKGGSLIELMMSESLPNVIENWDEVAHHVALRLRTESRLQGGVEAFERAAEHLAPGVHTNSASRSPVVPTILRLGDVRLTLFATLAQFGTPIDVTLDDLKIEMYFPMDDETEKVLSGIAASA